MKTHTDTRKDEVINLMNNVERFGGRENVGKKSCEGKIMENSTTKQNNDDEEEEAKKRKGR